MNPLKTIFLFSILSFVYCTSNAQTTKNFYELQKELNSYFSDKKIDFGSDGELKQFRRAEQFMNQRVYPSGHFDNPSATWEAYQNELKKSSHEKGIESSGSWNYLGPGNYHGRVNCIIIDPNDSNTYWLGGASSGIWKSTNAGVSWTDMCNNMPVITIADIVVNPSNSNEIYAATGDNFGWAYSSTFYGYTMGVLKSTDGGNTWNPTGLSWNLDEGTTMRRLITHPNSPNTLIAATSLGVYRTTDGGNSWALTKGGNVFDIEYHPTDNNIVYAVTDSIFRSTDGGLTWNHVAGSPIFNGTLNIKYRRVAVEATPAAPNNVYVMYSELNGGGLLYKSTDVGSTFDSLVCPTSSEVNGYLGYWTGVLEVSPTDTNRIIVGGTSLAVTTNEGTNWTTQPNTYVDQHAVTFLSDGVRYIGGNDGGAYKRNPGLMSMNNGLQLTQFYRMGASATDSSLIIGGRQDGGTLLYSGNVSPWVKIYNNDGTEAIVDYTDPDIIYASYQFGNFAKSTNGGLSFTPIPTGSGYWMAPMVIHPTNPQILFYGGYEVAKSIDGGLSWNDISVGLPTTYSMAVAKSNPNFIYVASSWNTINKTINGGTNWSTASSGLPPLGISYIAISPTDPDKVWIVFSGFFAGQKVYKTTNGGASWSNISGTLPNIPVNCITIDDNSPNEALYIGTDIGVYYFDNTLSDWTYFSSGLPAVVVNELEIHYGTSKIRAATYGRGMWESPLYSITGIDNEIEIVNTASIFPNPTNGNFYVDLNFKELTSIEILISNTLGQTLIKKTVRNTFERVPLDLSDYPNGIYYVTVNGNNQTITQKIIKADK